MIKLHLDYLTLPRKIIPAFLIWTIIFNRGSVMGFIKFTKGTQLSDKDRKALQKLLTAEKKKLQSALKDVDASLSMLSGSKKAKKKK
ncbi:hypothetical protein [Bradyrhizobium sp. CCBAU 45389]|uniref:hypothetical protein n=1 Tax=Bradyrhizobium sp. CCBAU 45389 TaxID=858429 RepID=UPI0023058535|nr:hypothetical protein [Bradyrhizobium sp. CCBAU 45389]